MTISRRHHFSPRFYLSNFADTEGKIWCYERKYGKWNCRTPNGIGWFPHLYRQLNFNGKKTDDFEKFLADKVETPAAPAMKNAATAANPTDLKSSEREAIALFMAFMVARAPTMINRIIEKPFEKFSSQEHKQFEDAIKYFCNITNNKSDLSRIELFKTGYFEAIKEWAFSLKDRLLQRHWAFLKTTRDCLFITSDWPVFAYEYGEAIVSFPLSAEVALLISTSELRNERDPKTDVKRVNWQTMCRASEFIVCHQKSFLGDSFLDEWTKNGRLNFSIKDFSNATLSPQKPENVNLNDS